MPRYTNAEYAAFLARHPKMNQPTPAKGVDRESDLHRAILDWCANQWPRWKVLHARMDKPSTIEPGAHDLTIFAPGGRVLCVECKTRTGKVSAEQAAWSAELLRLGHTVHVCRDFDSFLTIADKC